MLEQFLLDHFAGRASLVQQNVAHTFKPWQEYGHDADKIEKDNHNSHEANRSLLDLPEMRRDALRS